MTMMRQSGCRATVLVCFLAGLLLGNLSVTGASPSAAYLPRRWTTEDGLPHNTVSALHQSASGRLWVGTWFGVARFDGQRVHSFGLEDSAGLASAAVNEFTSGPDGNLRVATGNGLLQREASAWHRFTKDHGLPGNKVWHVAFSTAGAVWGLTDKGCFRRADGRVQNIGPLPNGQKQ